MIPFRATSGYKPHRNGKMPFSLHEFLCLFVVANLFEEIAAETNRYIKKMKEKNLYDLNRQYAKLRSD
jgi:hypothetical protein